MNIDDPTRVGRRCCAIGNAVCDALRRLPTTSSPGAFVAQWQGRLRPAVLFRPVPFQRTDPSQDRPHENRAAADRAVNSCRRGRGSTCRVRCPTGIPANSYFSNRWLTGMTRTRSGCRDEAGRASNWDASSWARDVTATMSATLFACFLARLMFQIE